jgi:hypothetical protein
MPITGTSVDTRQARYSTPELVARKRDFEIVKKNQGSIKVFLQGREDQRGEKQKHHSFHAPYFPPVGEPYRSGLPL